MKLKIKTIRCVHKNENYQIFGCDLLEPNDDIVLNKYGNISLKDNTLVLSEDKEYVVEVKGVNGKYGMSYEVVSIPSMQIDDIDTITDDMELDLLKEITTDSQSNYVHDAYPNFIRLILRGEQDKIDVSKIYNVGEYRLNSYIRSIEEKFKYYYIMEQNRHYELSINDCKALCKIYPTVEKVNKMLDEVPYFCLISVCGRSFTKADKMIMEVRDDLGESDQRTEFMILDVLKRNESEGSTYMDANEMAQYVNGIDSRLVKKLKDVSIDSELIYYEEKTKRIAIASTYMAECEIAEFVKSKVDNSSKLNWDWKSFKKIKDGELTEEQSEVLHQFCEHSFIILNAGAGVGKSSTMMAVINMADEYNYSYKLLSPTGRASKRLSEQTGRDASTIHRGTQCGEGELSQDIIIVDEASMMTIETFLMIVNTISNPNARIMLILDIEQLPPIGLGFVAKELIESGVVPTCTLTKVFRFSSGGLSYTTTLARKGKYYLSEGDDEKDEVVLGKEKDYKYLRFNNNTEQIIDEYMSLINKGVKKEEIAIITPRNTGDYGTYNLNNLIQAELNPPKANENAFEIPLEKGYNVSFRKGDLVLVKGNNYNMLSLEGYELLESDSSLTKDDVKDFIVPIFNGEIGKILSIDEKTMKVQIGEEIIVFYKIDAYNLLLGYVMTSWKLQGSEIKYPIVLTLNEFKGSDEKHNQLNKSVLYTNLSRGKVKVTEIADISAIKHSLNTLADTNMKSRIGEMLKCNT